MIGLAKLIGLASAPEAGEGGRRASAQETGNAFNTVLARFGLGANGSAGEIPVGADARGEAGEDVPQAEGDEPVAKSVLASGLHRVRAAFATDARGSQAGTKVDAEPGDAFSTDAQDVPPVGEENTGAIKELPHRPRPSHRDRDDPAVQMSAQTTAPVPAVVASAPLPAPVMLRPDASPAVKPDVSPGGNSAPAVSAMDRNTAEPAAPSPDGLPVIADAGDPVTVNLAAVRPDSATLLVEATVVGRETHMQPLAPRGRAAPVADPHLPPLAEAEKDAGLQPASIDQDVAPRRSPDRPPDQTRRERPDAVAPRRAPPRAERGFVREAAIDKPERRTEASSPATSISTSANAAPVAVTAAPASGDGLPSRALHAIASAVATTVSASPDAATAQPGEAARVLTVRLDLPDHGGVEVRIRMADTAISIRVVADRDDTARRIRHVRDELTDALRQAGHDATVTSVESRRVEAPDAARQQQAATTPNGGQGTGANPQGGGERSLPQPRPQPFMETDSRTEMANGGTPADRPLDRLYV